MREEAVGGQRPPVRRLLGVLTSDNRRNSLSAWPAHGTSCDESHLSIAMATTHLADSGVDRVIDSPAVAGAGVGELGNVKAGAEVVVRAVEDHGLDRRVRVCALERSKERLEDWAGMGAGERA